MSSVIIFSLSAVIDAPEGKSGEEYGLIATLGLAQRLNIAILPITWQASLGRLGEGAQSAVNQAAINLQSSFAFKCFRDEPFCGGRRAALQEVFREMTVLGHPAIRSHPHLLRLEGICWDVVDDRHVLPVLVFEKSPLGDLHRFMNTEKGSSLLMKDRLGLCRQIGEALRDMHASGIIHGDVKPQNVLVFEATPGDYVAKVADFGYSTRFRGPDDLVFVPKSVPWYAPEHHFRAFHPPAAQKMDIYSFGVLCLWMICGTGPSPSPDREHQIVSFERHLEELRNTPDASVSDWASSLSRELGGGDNDLGTDLPRFFQLALALDPSHRAANIDDLLPYLHLVITPPHPPRLPDFDQILNVESFRIQDSLSELYQADFRLRRCIMSELDDIVSASPRPVFRGVNCLEAAEQLSLCFQIGFGTPRDDSQVYRLLSSILLDQAALDKQVAWIRQTRPKLTLYDGLFKSLFSEGHIKPIDFPQRYRERGLSSKAEAECIREISDISYLFGASHWLTMVLESQLANLLASDGRWKEAEELTEKVLEFRKASFGLGDPETLQSIADLGTTYGQQGRWLDAERLDLELLEIRTKHLGRHHPDTLMSMANLASTYRQLAKFSQAQTLEEEVLSVRRSIFGDESHETLDIMTALAATYQAQGRWFKAEELQSHVVKTSNYLLGDKHPDTLTARAYLAATFMDQGRLEESEDIQVQVLKTREAVLGEAHPDTLSSMANLSAIYDEKGLSRESEELATKALQLRRKVLGPEHPDTLTSAASLAAILSGSGQWAEAETLEASALDLAIKHLGHEHPLTLSMKGNMVVSYHSRGRWGEARRLAEEIRDARMKVLGDEHPDTLLSISDLAMVLTDQGSSLDDAEKLGRTAHEKSVQALGADHPTTLEIASRLASTYLKLERWKEAEQLVTQVRHTRSTRLGSGHPDALSSAQELVNIYNASERWEKAESLAADIVAKRKEALGETHPDTLVSMGTLASAYRHQGKLEKAEELELYCVEKFSAVLGPDHPDTLRSQQGLATIYWEQGRLGEAEEQLTQILGEGHDLEDDDPVRLEVMESLASIYRELGKLEQAEELETKLQEFGTEEEEEDKKGEDEDDEDEDEDETA